MKVSQEEEAALALFTNFVRQNQHTLSVIAHWGDGRCGDLQRIMADILIGPEPSREVARKREAIPAAVRRLVHERDGYRCVHCGSQKALRIDHVFPWSKGGSSDEGNLQTLCHPCNQAKGAQVGAAV